MARPLVITVLLWAAVFALIGPPYGVSLRWFVAVIALQLAFCIVDVRNER